MIPGTHIGQSQQWDCARVQLRLAELKVQHALNPPPAGTQMSAFRAGLSDMPPEWQGLALSWMAEGVVIGNDMNTLQRMKYKRESYLCGVGLFLLLVGASLPFFRPLMTSQQSEVTCALIAAGLAGFLVFLPGFMKLQGKMQPNQLLESLEFQSGGAAAIFIIAFLILRYAFHL
jgi:hypothetical protein